MTTWVDNPYWKKADDMAKNVYHQLFSQISERATYFYESKCILDLDYSQSIQDSSGCIDFALSIKTDSRLSQPDNLGFCLSAEDHCEVEIITYVPKHYRINTLKKSLFYQRDLLNVIRHEIEHMFQSGAYAINNLSLVDYDCTKENFLLNSEEVPAYVHGFRISSKDDHEFNKKVDEFISSHGSALKLQDQEIQYTKKVWKSYLKNLNN